MAKHYGVLTFDNRGPIKSWERMTSVQRHNARTEELPHCDPAAPEPFCLRGSVSLVEDAQRELCLRGLDPSALRANGVIAHEVILTASHEYFAQGDEAERNRRLWHWVARAYLAAIKIWRKVTIVQMVLHLDEYTPHIHVVLMPLVKKVFGRRPDDGERWTLNGREITGPGEFQRAHDEYATEMKPLGLQPGVSGSGRKYRPFAEKAAEMDEQCKRAAAEADAVNAKQGAEKAEQARAAHWADEFDRLKCDRLELKEGQRLLKVEQAKVRADMLRQEVTRRALAPKEAHPTKISAQLAELSDKAAAALAEADRIRVEAQRALASALKVRAHADTLMAMANDLETARLIQARDAARAQAGCVDDALEEADLGNQLALLSVVKANGR
ncbi:plasmid recombination protein [Sphingomonas sp. GM_Shp_1]|uniref:plasmid recombination protein n=1 Tax=Sphingomonas sp. GM_Shp_1 TaxID=2937381 RepID=UPI00226BA38B|nr:plasmid recombination protein [Sphingomonas sp. GM_Shp_1]